MRRIVLAAAFATLVAAGCGSDSGSLLTTPPNGGGHGSMTATIDGQSWSAGVPDASYTSNVLVILGFDAAYSSGLTIGGSLTAPGTYPLGSGSPNGVVAGFSTATGAWSTQPSGGSGTLVITTLTSSHVVGTFTFDAVPQSGGATGTRHVTNGKFDITF